MKSLLSLLILIGCFHAQGQLTNIELRAKVLNEAGKPLNKAIIQTFKDGLLFSSDTSKSNGKLDLITLPVGSKYEIVISKSGYVNKIAIIDAFIVEEDTISYGTIPLQFHVELFIPCEAGDYEFLKAEPLIKWKLHESLILDYDKDHLKMMLKKVEDSRYGNLTLDEHETFSTNYFGGMELMEFQSYDEGLAMLMKAKEIVDCPYVIAKIDECRQLQKTQAAYYKYVARADSLYAIGKYREAGNVYKIAGNIKEDERYPAKQLALIQYQKVIAKANEYFEAKDYESALKYYDRAAKIKPDDKTFEKNLKKCRKKVK